MPSPAPPNHADPSGSCSRPKVGSRFSRFFGRLHTLFLLLSSENGGYYPHPHMQAAVHRPQGPGMARGRRGQSLVEMAVALPLLLLLVAGALDLAHVYSVSSIVANAVREGARYGATQPNDSSGIQNRVVQEAAGAPLTLTASEVHVTYDPGASSGSALTVEVAHDVDLLLAQALGFSLTIRRHATMVIF